MIDIKDKKYNQIVKDIIDNSEFKKLNYIHHHGISRLEHSIKVSYASYKIAVKLGMDYKTVARGGLLHDFFLDGDERSKWKKFTDTFTHPRRALATAKANFKLNLIEENIIVSHMAPFGFNIPKYKESILVNLTDKVIGSWEFMVEYFYKFKYRLNYSYLLLLMFIR